MVESIVDFSSKFGSGLMSGDYSKQPAPVDENSTQDIVHVCTIIISLYNSNNGLL